MQISDIKIHDSRRALNAANRPSSDSTGFAPPPPPMAGDRAQIRTRPAPSAPKRQKLNLAIGWAALAFALFAFGIALAFGQLAGALGLILGWLSAAFAYAARRELLALFARALR